MNLYHTRTVEGMTGIAIRTIQVYVHDFREYFSEEARKPSKGRRFNPKDIDILQTIQRLRAGRFQDDEIRKVLSGETPLMLAHQFDETKVKDFAAHALEYFEDANETLKEANQLIRSAQDQIKQLKEERELLRADYRALRDRVDQFKRWQLHVLKEIPELNLVQYSEEEPTTREKKGLFGKLLG